MSTETLPEDSLTGELRQEFDDWVYTYEKNMPDMYPASYAKYLARIKMGLIEDDRKS